MRAAVHAGQVVEFGKQWQGQTVDARYPLQQYLGGSDTTAVFATSLPADATTRAAIKLIRASGAEAEALLANWTRAAHLSHPNLLRVFDGGRCWLSGHELLFVVTEYAEEDLAQVLPYRALNASETDATLRPIVLALNYLHEQGFVHTQLRPSNITAVNDVVKLSSDGIQAAGVVPHKENAGPYDPPELATDKLSPAADIWSLGVTLAEVLTQRSPERMPQASELPAPFAEIVSQCVKKNPASRWTIRQVARALNVALPESAVEKTESRPQPELRAQPVRPDSAVRTATFGKRSSRVIWGFVLIALITLALAITLTYKLLHHGGVQEARPNVSATPTVSSGARQPAERQAPVPTGSSVVHQVLPEPSRSALNTIHGRLKVRIRVNVDNTGDVTNARFLSAGPSAYFSRLAMQAAQQWKFTTAVSEWDLRFEFTRGGVEAFSEQVESR